MNDDTPLPLIDRGSARILHVAILVAAILLGGAAIVFARHYARPDPATEPHARGMTVGSDSMTLAVDAPMWNVIKVAPAAAAEPHWTDRIPARIVFDETRTSRIGSPLAGRVTTVMVERGEHVKQGDRLFTVSSPNLAELRVALEKAMVELATAKISVERTRALVEAGSIPGKELVTAQQQVTEAQLAVKLASQKLASLRVERAGDAAFTVTAPRDGVVVEKNVAVGQGVDPSAGSVLAIADVNDVWVIADLFENDVGALAPGTEAKVTIGGTRELDATIDQVSAVIDPDRHTVPVRVKLANPNGTLRPNAYAQIRFYDPIPAKVALPASAVLSDGLQSYTYVKSATGELKRRNLVVGSASGGDLPVLEGVAIGEQVVVQGAILLDNQIRMDN